MEEESFKLVTQPDGAVTSAPENRTLARRGLIDLGPIVNAPTPYTSADHFQEALRLFTGSTSTPKDRTRSRECLDLAARLGSQHALAASALFGEPLSPDIISWICENAGRNDAFCQYVLGVAYLGETTLQVQDEANAAYWLQKAAESGISQAQFKWAGLLESGRGVKEDQNEANYWLEQAAAQGHAAAMTRLAERQMRLPKSTRDANKAFTLYQQAAEKGDADAQCVLAESYAFGDGNGLDPPEVPYFSVHGHQPGTAHFYLEVARRFGRLPLEQSDTFANIWYERAASQGHTHAQIYLATRYANGIGIAKDVDKAIEWYRCAATQRSAAAQCYLGWMYMWGDPAVRNQREGFAWFLKAADQGDATGQSLVGLCYHRGNGVECDHARAVVWLRSAAEKGNRAASFYLGKDYAAGCGVELNDETAMYWFRRAAELRHPDAIELIRNKDGNQAA